MSSTNVMVVFEVQKAIDMDEVGAMQDFARKVFVHLGFMPIHGMIRCSDGKLLVLSPDPDIDKSVFAQLLREFARKLSADMAMLCVEAWFAEGLDDRPPSERPDRREGVMVFEETVVGASLWVAEIKRLGDVCELGDFQKLPSETVGGGMSCLLPTN